MLLATGGFAVTMQVACGASVTAPLEGNDGRCIVGGTEGTRGEVSEALSAVDGIYKNPAFWKLVGDRTWLGTPTGPAPLKGDDVANTLSKVDPSERGYAVTHLRWSNVPFIKGRTIAQTAPCGNVTIDIKHVSTVEMLVNTIAHENTHVPGNGGGPIGCEGDAGTGESRFLDGDYDEATKVWLVSYSTGDLAECFYLDQVKKTKKFEDCMAHIEDGSISASFDRRHAECCACGKTCPEAKLLAAVRQQAGTCTAVTCEPCKKVCPDQ